MRVDLSLQQAPPFSVPARFMISAPLFGVIAALIMLWQGPTMINHRWTSELLAVTHLLTLGYLGMSMMGALMQLLPVLMGQVIKKPILFSWLVHMPLFIGCFSLSMAWLIDISELFIIAVVLLAIAFCIFIPVMMQLLLRSSSRHATRSMMLQALISLTIAIGLGLYLALGHSSESYPIARNFTDLHLSWGLFGWVALLIIAVAYQVIPMFQITNEYPALHQRLMGWSIFIILLAITMAYVFQMEWLIQSGTKLLAICLMIFAVTTLWVLQHRRRQLPDLTLNFWRLSMISLIMLNTSWLITKLVGVDLPPFLFGVLIIHGFAMTTVNGMVYKIIPFIIWLHLSAHNKKLRDSGHRDLQIKVPHMRKIIPEKAGYWQFRAHLISLMLLILTGIWSVWFLLSSYGSIRYCSGAFVIKSDKSGAIL